MKFLEQKFNYLFITEVDNNYVGFCLLTDNQTHYELIYIYSAPIHTRQGFGTALIQYLTNTFLNAAKAKYIFLEVSTKNKSAINFYERLGFKHQSLRKKYYKNGDDALIMNIAADKLVDKD